MKIIKTAAILMSLAVAALLYLRNKTDFFRQGEQNSVRVTPAPQKRQMRELTLDNQLKVLLISDPSFNKSAAAMDVGVGSLQDPAEHLGLAHFLEHMLFMGTQKYPDVDEFNRYLTSFQGYSNAYTSDEDTNFHFEVNHDGFAGAVDRFAQFFISPLFDPHFVERERNAVHSEHEKNLQSDIWRSREMVRSQYLPTHPAHQFSTGTKHTLAGVTREILLRFYKDNYSANTMKLVLMSPLELDQMAALASKEFSAIPNHNYTRPVYPTEVFAKNALPKMLTVKAVKDLKKLSLQFPTPCSDPYWRAKPEMIITHLVGHESQGSLLSQLKQQDYATTLSAWHESTSYNGIFHFDINLTDKGLVAVDEVIAEFFTYINMLKAKGLEDYIFAEIKTMAEINYTYRDLLEGSSVASHFADLMQQYPALEIEKNDMLFFEKDPEAYNTFLASIRPDNLFAMVIKNSALTDKVERHYGTGYSLRQLNEKSPEYIRWQEGVAQAAFALPPRNEFIPTKLSVTAASDTKPRTLIDDSWGRFWYQGDNTFLLPKGYIQLLLLTEEANRSPRQKVLATLYTQALRESLNEWNYNISLAGLNFAVGWNDRGISVNFFGYSQNLPALVAALSERMQALSLGEKQFAALKDAYKRNIVNGQLDAAYQQSMYEISFLSNKDAIHRNMLYQPEKFIDLISGITLDEVKAFARDTLFSNIAIEGAAFGNLDAQELTAEIKNFYTTLSTQALASERRPINRQIKIPAGKLFVEQVASTTNNSCWATYFQAGPRSPELSAILQVGISHLRTSFFNELRTNQQLGYVVHSGVHNSEKSHGMLFLVQSGQYSPETIAERFSAWQTQALAELEKLSPEEFAAFTSGVATEMREKDKTMADRHQTLIYEAITLDGKFNYKESVAQAAEKLTKQQVLDVFRKAFSKDDSAALAIYLYKQKTPMQPLKSGELVSDPGQFRSQLSFF
jgi:insulysin